MTAASRLAILAVLVLLPQASQAEDDAHDKLVYSRYSRGLQRTAYNGRYGRLHQLDHPATPEDVEEGEAIFSFEGLGARRVWRMKPFPLQYGDRHKDSRISATVWQAEELEVESKWKRYYGVICNGQAAVLPAEHWDAWWPDAPWIPHQDRPFDPKMGTYQPFGAPGYWAITLSRPSPKPRPRNANDPLVATVHFFNTSLRPTRFPTTWTRSPQDDGPAMLDALSLSLRRTPFDPEYPLLKNAVELKPTHTTRLHQDGAMRSVEPGKKCELFNFNLHDWFSIEDEGYYTLGVKIDSKALGADDESGGECNLEFTIGTPPVLPSIEEYNQAQPVLGGADNEARLRKLISETIKPKPIDRQPLPPNLKQALEWSEPVNGLAGRIEHIFSPTIVVRLKNASQEPLVVPTGNPREENAPQPFEIYARLSTEPWQRARRAMEPYCEQTSPDEDANRAYLTRGIRGIETDRPLVTLRPGEHCLAFVEMLYEEYTEFKVVLRRPETDEARHWSGVLETPARQKQQTYDEALPLVGRLTMPEHFPTLTYSGYSPSGTEPAVQGLWYGNWELLRLLPRYDPAQVCREFERRMAAERRMPMKLLLAAIAARADSDEAALYLLEMAKTTDFRTSVNVHAVLALLFPYGATEVPEWIVQLSIALLADKRFLTDLEGTDWEGRCFTIRSDEFRTPLWSVLVHAKCEMTVPVLLEWASSGDYDAVYALTEMADERVVPILIELARKGHLRSIAALGRTGDRRAIPTLIELTEDPRLGPEAAMALSKIDAKQVVSRLVQVLEDVEPNAMEARHRDALQKLAEIDAEQARPLVAELLKKVDPSQVTMSYGRLSQPLSALAKLSSELKAKEAVPALLMYVQYPEIIEALGSIGDPAALPVLQEIVDANGRITKRSQGLSEQLDAERLFAANMALRKLDSDGGVSRLLEMLSKGSLTERQRDNAIAKLADYQNPMAIPVLLDAIQVGKGHYAINSALLGLANLKYRTAVEGLVECFDVDFKEEQFNKGDYVTPAIYRNRIARALQQLTGQPFGADKQQWLQWWHEEGQHSTNLK